MFDLSGRVALVTGAGQNVGAGIARLLAKQGAIVAVNDLFADRATQVAKEIGKAIGKEVAREGGAAQAFPFDVTDADAVRAGVSAVESALGPIDILVNNAGVPPGMGLAQFRELDPAEWKKYVDLNLYGVLHCVHAVIDGMVEREHGRIITISSGAAQQGITAGVSIYGAAKAGAVGFSRHLAMEVADKGVTVNSLALGLMDSGHNTDVTRMIAKTIPVKRVGTPEDAAAAVLYLASQEASWVTGQTIGLNGGSIMN